METHSTVKIEPVANCNALRMTWQHHVAESDVRDAFKAIVEALESADQPMYVIVDLLQDPLFPLRTTIFEGLRAYRHPKLIEWLIVGGNGMAHMVEATFSTITRRKNVYWFASEQNAIAHIAQTQPEI